MSKEYSNKTLYGVYTQEDELLYFGTATQIAKEFGCKQNSIYCNISRKQKFKKKYFLVRMGKENEQ